MRETLGEALKTLSSTAARRECRKKILGCEGLAFFSQLIGQTVVDLLNEKETPVVDNQILSAAVKRIVEHPPPQLLYMWEGFEPRQKLLLAGLAPTLRSGRDYASAARVQKVLESVGGDHLHDFDSTTTRLLLEQLRSGQVLERDQTRFRFKMDLLRLWVKEEHTVWNVLPELGEAAVGNRPYSTR